MKILQYPSISALNTAFVNQEFDAMPDEIAINEQFIYKYFNSGEQGSSFNLLNFKQLEEKKQITWVAYDLKVGSVKDLHRSSNNNIEDSFETPNTLLVFGWKTNGLSLIPAKCVSIARNRVSNLIRIQESEQHVIGKTLDIQFPQLGNNTYEAKVDTGAGQSCLHAEQIKASGESVSFVFDGKRITMNQTSTSDIQTADNGVDKRPVIKLNVKCEQGEFQDVEFNLNDRGDMPHKILLGHSFFEKGKFLVDPLQESDEVELEWIKEIVEKYFND